MFMQVIDGTNLVFGRASSRIAKSLLEGEEIKLINAEKMILTGRKDVIVERYMTKRRLQNKATPEHSPKWPRVPHLLVKRMVRGMLPWKTKRGREAHKRLKVYTGNPENLKPTLNMEDCEFKGLSKHITILELCKHLGYNPRSK